MPWLSQIAEKPEGQSTSPGNAPDWLTTTRPADAGTIAAVSVSGSEAAADHTVAPVEVQVLETPPRESIIIGSSPRRQ